MIDSMLPPASWYCWFSCPCSMMLTIISSTTIVNMDLFYSLNAGQEYIDTNVDYVIVVQLLMNWEVINGLYSHSFVKALLKLKIALPMDMEEHSNSFFLLVVCK